MAAGNASAFTALDAMIGRLRAVKGLAHAAAPAIARELDQELDANIDRGVGPDGKPWELTKAGKTPLRNAAKALAVRAVGTVILARLTGPEAKHHKGIARGHIARRILPTRKIPAPMVEVIKRVLSQKFTETMTGGGNGH